MSVKRFQAIELVMKYGSESDRKNPFHKAEQVLAWVEGKDVTSDTPASVSSERGKRTNR